MHSNSIDDLHDELDKLKGLINNLVQSDNDRDDYIRTLFPTIRDDLKQILEYTSYTKETLENQIKTNNRLINNSSV